jgi:hypothetical protein
MLKATVKALTEVDEKYRDLYKQVGEEFVLDLDDGEFKTRISEFRNNNIELTRQLEEMTKKGASVEDLQKKLAEFDGIDVDAAKEAMTQAQQMKDKKLLDSGKIDELIAERTDRMRQDYDGKVTALEKALEKAVGSAGEFKSKLSTVVIDNSLQQAVSQVAAVRKGAMQDIIARGRSVWSLDDQGNPIPNGPDGSVLYGADAKTPLSMTEWAESLVKDADYLFDASSGGGSNGNDKGDGGKSTKGVPSHDQDAISQNLEGIASGDVQVVNN